MIRNYLKIGFRSLLKHKKSSFINMAGLAIAFSVCLVLFVFLDRLYHMDTCHENSDRIFMVESVVENNDQERIYGNSPTALSTSMKMDLQEVEDATRMQYTTADFSYDDKVFNEQVIFVDRGFMDMFTFPLKSGSTDALKHKDRIVLSENAAKKYFGNSDPVDKQVTLLFNIDGKEYLQSYFVGAVADKFPYLTSIRFNILVPFENRKELGFNEDGDWESLTYTFVMLQHAGQAEKVNTQINKYTALQNESNPDWKINGFILDPLESTALNAQGKESMLAYNAPLVARILLSVITVFILVLAIFNYVNIALVSATSRLKEIGLRKTIGGYKSQIMGQFIIENTVLCFMALVIGYLLTLAFTLPGFNSIASASNPMILELGNPRLWLFVAGLFILITIGSAAYPAFFISQFKPVQILKGNFRLASRNIFTRSLLSVQFIISFITISLGVVFVLNNQYVRNRDWGYDREHTLIVPLVNSDQYPELKSAIAQNSNIKVISGSQGHIGYWTEQETVEFESEKYICRNLSAGYSYLEVLGIRLKSGRFFEENSETDLEESIVVNEAFVKNLNLDHPIGKKIIMEGRAYYIVGVAEDFHYMHFRHEIKPLVFNLTNETNFNYLVLRTNPGAVSDVEDYVKSTWKKLYPHNTYEGFFQNTAFDFYFRENQGIANLMVAIAIIAILISSMGLFGLVSLLISKRMKEYSIRKVMGASEKAISFQIGNGFIWVIIIASIIGAPLAYLMSDAVIQSVYSYHLPINAFPFIITAMILMVTALATVASNILKAVRVNPATQLRNE